jgi:hypothetical protein
VTKTDAFALPRSDLNGFLFSDIGVETNGMTLSVLSALSRLGMDPWQEAGRLANLPRTAAVDGLARIISALPASLWTLSDATTIAARLVALLPARSGAPSLASTARPAMATSQTISQRVVVLALLIGLAGLMLGLQWRAASDSPAVAHSSASRPASPALPPVGHAPSGEKRGHSARIDDGSPY